MKNLTSKGQTWRKYWPHSKDKVTSPYMQEFEKGE